MRGLPLIVGVMTVLIFAGMGLLVYGFAKKGAEIVKTAPPAALQPPVSITLPAGASIQHMSGWKGGLALHVTADDGEYIYFMNGDGGMAGRTEIRRETNAPAQP